LSSPGQKTYGKIWLDKGSKALLTTSFYHSIMELIINRKDRNKVFTFDGTLGEQVWEPEPITRFRIKKPIDNEWIKEQLAANQPTAGIIFNGVMYIGTND
jgi:hypothetical protein